MCTHDLRDKVQFSILKTTFGFTNLTQTMQRAVLRAQPHVHTSRSLSGHSYRGYTACTHVLSDSFGESREAFAP